MTRTDRVWAALDLTRPADAAPDADVAGHLAAFLDDYHPTAIVDSSTTREIAWRVFFDSAAARDAAWDALAAARPDVGVGSIDVPDELWAERSQASLRAVRIDRLVVTPPWDLDRALEAEDPEAPPGIADAAATVVVIEPSMGFGTGHHESTRLCLRALQRLDVAGRDLVDLGTGSGVLAIAAARLGARRAIAIDDDPDALAAAEANVARNGVTDRVELRRAALGDGAAPRGDIVLANLTGALLRRLAHGVRACLAPGGTLILSGFTDDERAAVSHAFLPLTVGRSDTERGWVALTLHDIQ